MFISTILKILAKFSHGNDLRALNPAKMEATKKNNFSRRTPHSLLEIASSTMCRLVIEEVNTEQYPPHGALELGDEGQLRF